MSCRHDWHQTASGVTVAVYCKRFDPAASRVDVGPVRLRVHIAFPEAGAGGGAAFDMDMHLAGVRRLPTCPENMGCFYNCP